MTLQHTSGPWVYDADSGEVFSDTRAHGCGWIALVKGNDNNDTPLPKNEQLANAALIAAAPDLLAALQEMLKYAEGFEDADHVIDARAAITRAIGA